jgi:hypothetical protein
MPPEPTKPTTGEGNRRRSFFTSTLVIKPPPATPFVNTPPTQTILAALSSPRTIAKSKTIIKVNPTRLNQPSTEQASRPEQATSSSSNGIKKVKDKGTEKKFPSSQTTSKQIAIGKSKPVVPAGTDRAAKARAARLVKLAKAKAEREAEAANPTTTEDVPDEPRRTRRATFSTSTGRPTVPIQPLGAAAQDTDSAESSPPHLILPVPKRVNVEKAKKDATPLKSFMEAGFYCQDDHAKSPYKLVSRVLFRREAEEKAKSIKQIHPNVQVRIVNAPTFPPLPYDHGYKLFFDEVQDFVLPFNIQREAENGFLDGKKKPAPYSKLKASKCLR